MRQFSTLRSLLPALVGALVLLTTLASPATSSPIGSGAGGVSQAVAAGLVSPVTTITFNEVPLPDGTALSGQYGAFNVGFSGPAVYCTSCDFNQFSTIDGPMAGNTFSPFSGPPYPFPFSVLFPNPVSAAAFATAAGGPFTLNAKLGGSTVGTLTGTNVVINQPPGTYQNFYGFYDLVFDEIEITGIGGNAFFTLDNLLVGAASAPEPATGLLIASGLAGLALRRRRLH